MTSHLDAHDPGLAHDLEAILRQRRRALSWVAGLGLLGVASAMPGCGGGGDAGSSASSTGSGSATTGDTSTGDGTTGSTSSGSTTGSAGSCTITAEETEGPYPADGSNRSNGGTSNALMLSGIVRSDIRSSIAGATGTAEGVELTLSLQLLDANASCADLEGYAIYVWHCDRDGNYSLYSSGVTNQNYLRGVQATDATGKATFTTIFPGCYSGRMPHIHIEVYRSVDTATSYMNKLKTTQLAFPVDVCQTVYATASGYLASVTNLSRISFATDNVFSDGVGTELATVSGSVAAGYTASLVLAIAA